MTLKRDPEETRSTLVSWLGATLPSATDVTVTGLELPVDGASNETIFFDAEWAAGAERHFERLVLRVQPDSYQLFLGGDVFLQWQMMEALAAHSSVPVPPLRWKEPDSSILGAPFYVMSRVEGEVPNGFHSELMKALEPAERQKMYANVMDAMAGVHQLDWREGFRFLEPVDPGEPGLDAYLAWVERWYEWAQDGRTFEAVEAGLAFLRERQPRQAPVSIIWGDSRPGNVMVDRSDQRVTAVLDWELAGLATPEVDLAWWLLFERVFTDGSGATLPEGVPTRDETLTVYEATLGRALADMRYFDVLAWTRFGITAIRHVDLERGGPNEAMFNKLQEFVMGCLTEYLAS